MIPQDAMTSIDPLYTIGYQMIETFVENLGLSKELGTRHRAGVGISEVSDSLTIIVSEETGKISIAIHGKLLRNIDGEL